MPSRFNTASVEPINDGIRKLFQAVTMGPTLRAQRVEQQALLDTQQQQATHAAYKAALESRAAGYGITNKLTTQIRW